MLSLLLLTRLISRVLLLLALWLLPALTALALGPFSSACVAKGRPESPSINIDERPDSPPSAPTVVENLTKQQKYLAIGQWGATGISFDVSANSVGIEFNNAHANIGRRPKLNKKGEFDVIGLYNSEGPPVIYIPPVRPGEPLVNSDNKPGQEARFRGKVSGKKMSLTISFVKTGKTLGTYTLELGKPAIILKPM